MSVRSRKKRQQKRDRARQRAAAKAERQSTSTRTSSAKASSDRRRRSTKAFTIDASRHWYAARMVTGMREKACEALKKLGVTTFVARASEPVARRRGLTLRRTPLIPGIVFVGLAKDLPAQTVADQQGVAGLLSYFIEPDEDAIEGNVVSVIEKPARLDPTSLQRFVDALAIGEIERPAGIQQGDTVVLRAGPFASFPGVVEELFPDRERVKVGVSIFGKATPVEIGIAEVQVV